MLKADVMKHFKTASDVARTLKISPAAVCKWGEIVPWFSALDIERLSNGAVPIRNELYVRGKPLPELPANYAA